MFLYGSECLRHAPLAQVLPTDIFPSCFQWHIPLWRCITVSSTSLFDSPNQSRQQEHPSFWKLGNSCTLACTLHPKLCVNQLALRLLFYSTLYFGITPRVIVISILTFSYVLAVFWHYAIRITFICNNNNNNNNTLCSIKCARFIFTITYNNFSKCGPILTILSLFHFQMICRKIWNKIYQLASNLLSHYLTKIECTNVQFYSTLFDADLMQNILFANVKLCFICPHILIYNITAYVKIVCSQHTRMLWFAQDVSVTRC